jgi:succinoglycan biosynthesis transport protein ExoP
MPRYELELSDYERLFRRRYKFVLFCTLTVTAFAIIFAKLKPQQYQATSIIAVDRTVMWDSQTGTGATVYNEWDELAGLVKEVTGYAVLVRAAKKIGLAPDTLAEDVLLADENIIRTLDLLNRSIAVTSQAATNMITITVTTATPADAQQTANALAAAFKEYSYFKKGMQVGKTKMVIRRQLAQCDSEMLSLEKSMIRLERTRAAQTENAHILNLVDRQKNIDEQLEETRVGLASIGLQKESLAERRLRPAAPRGAPGGGDDGSRSRETMAWVSEYLDGDPGLISLNERLINQQLEQQTLLSHYTRSHPMVIALEQSIDKTLADISARLDLKAQTLQEHREKLLAQQTSLESRMRRMPGSKMEYAHLQREYSLKEKLRESLTARLQDLQIAQAGMVEDIMIKRKADMPGRPINDVTAKVAGIGLLLGFVLGILGALVKEMFDTSVYSVEDFERSFHQPVLGVIPHIRVVHEKKNRFHDSLEKSRAEQDAQTWLPVHFRPKEQAAEAFRVMRTNIESYFVGHDRRAVLITSSLMNEGKSIVCANLALACAQSEKRVLIIDCNLRLPAMERLFGLAEGAGLTDILVGQTPWQDCVRTVADFALGAFTVDDVMLTYGLDNLTILPAGTLAPNPAELLSSPRLAKLLTELRDYFDLILIDAPPFLPIADALILSKLVDDIFIVNRSGETPRKSLRLCLERLAHVQAHVAGIVLNDVHAESADRAFLEMSRLSEKQEDADSPDMP